MPLHKTAFGPAGQQLVTDQSTFAHIFGPVDFELGIIAGTRTIDPVSSLIIGYQITNDGKVSVECTRLAGAGRWFELVQGAHRWSLPPRRNERACASCRPYRNRGQPHIHSIEQRSSKSSSLAKCLAIPAPAEDAKNTNRCFRYRIRRDIRPVDYQFARASNSANTTARGKSIRRRTAATIRSSTRMAAEGLSASIYVRMACDPITRTQTRCRNGPASHE